MMRMKTVAAWSLIGCAVAALGAAPAGKGDSLADMKARLAKLKEEETALQAKIDAAEAPPAGTVPGVIADLNKLPKNLWPGDSDSQTKESLREKWLTDNIKEGAAYTFTGNVLVSSPTQVNEAGKPSVQGMQVTLDCGKQMVWGKEKVLRVICEIKNVKPEDALDWNEKTAITITGPMNACNVNGNPMEVRLKVSEKK